MSITLTLLAALFWLLPGVVALIFWNQIGRQHGVRRPDQPLTALNGLALAMIVSMTAHAFGLGLTELYAQVAAEQSWPSPGTPYRVMAELMTRPTTGNNARSLDVSEMGGVLEFAGILVLLCLLVAFLFTSQGLGLAFDSIDVHGQGWAFQHIIQPKSHGYAPVAFVLTTTFEEGRGLGYAGGIADIRLDETGEIRALALSEPERFVYSFGKAEEAKVRPGFLARLLSAPANAGDLPEGFHVVERDTVGGIIHLPKEAVRNILVLNFSKAELEQVVASEEKQS
ncbi:MAG TPA: hypothetical protein VF503_06750 [Sphingobium sp.]|uniref:hypothetical protein n=1 Tax=Sphingobium sp. TaxID=1912891 RepID=UPI002ED3ED29